MLGLEGEGSQSNNHSCGHEECLDDNTLVEECDQDSCRISHETLNLMKMIIFTNSVSFNNSKCSQKNQIDRSFLSLDVKCDEKTNGQEERRKQEHWLTLKYVLMSFTDPNIWE